MWDLGICSFMFLMNVQLIKNQFLKRLSFWWLAFANLSEVCWVYFFYVCFCVSLFFNWFICLSACQHHTIFIYLFIYLFIFVFSRAIPVAYGGSHSIWTCSWWPTPQLTAMPDPEPDDQGQGSNLHPHGY